MTITQEILPFCDLPKIRFIFYQAKPHATLSSLLKHYYATRYRELIYRLVGDKIQNIQISKNKLYGNPACIPLSEFFLCTGYFIHHMRNTENYLPALESSLRTSHNVDIDYKMILKGMDRFRQSKKRLKVEARIRFEDYYKQVKSKV